MILLLGLGIVALYFLTEKKEAEAAKEPEAEKEVVTGSLPLKTSFDGIFKDPDQSFFLNPVFSKLVTTTKSLASDFIAQAGTFSSVSRGAEVLAEAGVISRITPSLLATSLKGQQDWTQPYSGYVQMIDYVFPVLGTVLAGFVEGIFGKDTPATPNPILFQILREAENQRILQGLAYASLNEPYKSDAEKVLNQIHESVKSNANYSDQWYQSIVHSNNWSDLFNASKLCQNWEYYHLIIPLDVSIKNDSVWTKIDQVYLLNVRGWQTSPALWSSKQNNISRIMERDANILFNLYGFPKEIEREPAFGMIDPRAQILFNQMQDGIYVVYEEGFKLSSDFPANVKTYRDSEGNRITNVSKEIWGRFESVEDAMARLKPEEYKKYIAYTENLKRMSSEIIITS